MLVPGPGAPLGTEIKPIITVGDTIGDYRFEAIPDGISYCQSGKNEATVLVNHETSTVPFPYAAAAPTISQLVQRLRQLPAERARHPQGRRGPVAPRWSSTTATATSASARTSWRRRDGFEDRPLLFTNEEGIDWVIESPATQWPATTRSTRGAAGARRSASSSPTTRRPAPQADLGHGPPQPREQRRDPGYGYRSCSPATTRSRATRPSRRCTRTSPTTRTPSGTTRASCTAFVPDEARGDQRLLRLPDRRTRDAGPSRSAATSSRSRRTSRRASSDGADMMTADVLDRRSAAVPAAADATARGSAPPGAITSRLPASTARSGSSSTGATCRNNVFQFSRIEDMAYDKRPGCRTSCTWSTPAAARDRAPAATRSSRRTAGSGRWSSTPTTRPSSTSLSILIEGDDNPVKTLAEIHQPDNIESTVNGLLITEDPGQQPAVRAGRPGTAERDDRAAHAVQFGDAVAQRGPQGRPVGRREARPTWTSRRRPAATGAHGRRAASSMSRRSSGPGKFLINVQAHTLFVGHRHDDRAGQPRRPTRSRLDLQARGRPAAPGHAFRAADPDDRRTAPGRQQREEAGPSARPLRFRPRAQIRRRPLRFGAMTPQLAGDAQEAARPGRACTC